ncbi:hypothetical protein J7L67_02425 [bacterium]|nr:hypothetical protein [bacterium]
MIRNLFSNHMKICLFYLTVFMLNSFVPFSYAQSDISTQEYTKQKKEVRTLLVEGRQLYLEGKFDEAIEKFHQVTDIKPNHLGARIAIQTILDEMDRHAALEFKNEISNRMLLTEEELHEKRRRLIKSIIEKNKNGAVKSQKSSSRLAIEKKLQTIIPEINFTNAHLRDVIHYLHTVGDVNIIMDDELFEGSSSAEMPQLPDAIDVTSENEDEINVYDSETGSVLSQDAEPETQQQDDMSDRVTISLRDIPLIDALKYILRTKKIRYRIDDYAVWISRDVSAPDMITKSYKLLGGKCAINKLTFEKPSDDGPAPGARVEEIMNIKDVIKEVVPFPAGGKMYLDERTNTLVVTNTKENHDIISDLIEQLSVPAVQVEIETRFVQIGQFEAEELGLELFLAADDMAVDKFAVHGNASHAAFGQDTTAALEGFTTGLRFLTETIGGAQAPRGNILSIGGILGESDMKMILHALNQRQNVDILTCPKVTTLNGHQAEIKSITEFLYPQEFDVTPPVLISGVEVAEAVVEASDFTRRDVGVVLTVTPDVGNDNKTINLTLVPEVSRFVSWLDYGTDIGSTHVPQLQPLFSSQHVATSVVLHDGDTIVLGGTISTTRTKRKDKIPLLGDIPFIGRAFRSESETDNKVNLLIFVTARVITPNGVPLKEEQRQAQAVEK